MAPLLMQILRDRSRSTLIYFLFAILIIVFIFTFNTSGSSGGCGDGAGTQLLATVDGTEIDVGALQMGMQLTPDVGRGGRITSADVLAENTRFYRLSPVPVR